MSHKYGAELYRQSNMDRYARVWYGSWSCREFAQRDIWSRCTNSTYRKTPMSLKLEGLNMRWRNGQEQEGMAKFASLLLPDYPVRADGYSIWVDSLMDEDGFQVHPSREVYSLILFYIKYLSVQMKGRVDFDAICKSLIKRKHQCFHGIPEQQLGTALYFFAYVRYPEEMLEFRSGLNQGNGPGTAMRQLANLEEETVGVRVPASEFYWAMIEEWCGLFRQELRYIVDYHSRNYARKWYMPLLIQDVYDHVYDDDGQFDGLAFGDDEW